ncbi:uncharacterized protein [Periplaneta americana]|uniref:uncharacterized protein n=1 Tax=Periplaneta americana TaxID=6978 RepID=UPI0037E99EC1
MFYSYDLLCHKARGRFAIIWLLANNMTVTLKEVLNIPLSDVINDLTSIVHGNYPADLPGDSGKGFSLYLCNKLYYGVVMAEKIQLDTFNSELLKPKFGISLEEEGVKTRKKAVKRKPAVQPEGGRRKSVIFNEEDFMLEPPAIDITEHLDQNGDVIRVPEGKITLVDYLPHIEPEIDQTFREEPESVSAALIESRDMLPDVSTQIAVPSILQETLPTPSRQELPQSPLQTPQPQLIQPSEPTSPPFEPQQLLPPTSPQPPPPSTPPQSPPAPPPPLPQPLPAVTEDVPPPSLTLETIEPISQTRGKKRRRRRFLDKETMISSRRMNNQIEFWRNTLRVQEPFHDCITLEQIKSVPGETLLQSTRNLLPRCLKNLFTRHMITTPVTIVYTHDITIAKENGIQKAEHMDVTAAQPQKVPPGMSATEQTFVTQVEIEPPEESALIDTVIEVQRDAEQVPEQTLVTQVEIEPAEKSALVDTVIEVQRDTEQVAELHPTLPEELSAIQADAEKMDTSTRFKDDQSLLLLLQELWSSEFEVTFDYIFPPHSTDRITAFSAFKLLLDMCYSNLVIIHQKMHIGLPVPPIFILPVS